ncbi:MAG: acyltransferase family protein, partial [Saprospiraceae bacterium]|nr:acyltransferase family protein [Saprospiraceae bacterium]
MQSRLNFLDGLRGVAILLVIAFHAYSRWPHFVPYGDAYQNFPLFKLGWGGVELFFLISG